MPVERLAVVISSPRTGGAETQLRSLLPDLVRRIWHMRVFDLLEFSPLTAVTQKRRGPSLTTS